jgi:hypothetical protein
VSDDIPTRRTSWTAADLLAAELPEPRCAATETGTWSLLGDAAEYTLGETRKVILETVDAHGALTPKQVSELTTVGHELAKKTMQRMFWDGQLVADGGRYSIPFQTPVLGVPESPTEGQGDSGDSDLEGDQTTLDEEAKR